MSFFNKKDKEDTSAIVTGQVSQIPLQDKDIYVSVQRTKDLLKKIACEPNKFKAIDTIITETPDGKQAYNNYLRLANQGLEVDFYNRNTGRRVKRYDTEWRNFSAKLGVNNAEGLDGMVDQLHGSAIAHGGMACEVVVTPDGRDIEDVLLIDPATFVEYKWIEREHRYAIYQKRDDMKKVDLYEGNFLFIPHQPKVGRPDGTLHFLPSIPITVMYYQLLTDALRVLNRVALPRYKTTIDMEALLKTIPVHLQDTPKKQNQIVQDYINLIESNLARMGKDSDIITTSCNEIEILGGGVNGSGIDIRAWFDALDPLMVNSFTMTPVMMGRLTSGSYSLGTVEFKIVTDTVNSMRRGSKRIIEDIANIWARVQGYNVYAVVTHKPIDWEVQKDKLEVELMRMQKARRAEEYRWITHDEAAIEGVGAEKAPDDKNKDMFEYLSKDFREQNTVANNTEQKKS